MAGFAEERHRRADAARRQRLRVLQELFALKNDIAFAEVGVTD